MADLVFIGGRKLTESQVTARGHEDRIVAKTAFAERLKRDHTAADALSSVDDPAGRISDRHAADEPRPAVRSS